MPTVFPPNIDDQYTLLTAKDNVTTFLSQDVATDSSSIYVMDASEFPEKGVATVHNRTFTISEKFYYDSKTSNSFGNLTRPSPTAFSTCSEIHVSALVTEDYHNYLRDAVIEVEKRINQIDSTTSVLIIVDPTTGLTKFQDTTRADKWLSTTRESIDFSRNRRNLNSQYLYFDGMAGTVSGRGMIRDMTITALSVQCANNVNAWFRIRKNAAGIDLHSIQLSGINARQRDAITVDINKGDYLQVYMDVTSGLVEYPVVNIEYAWRFI